MNTERVRAFANRFEKDASLWGVEVGVFYGHGAYSLLSEFPNLDLILVDQFECTERYLASGDPTASLVSSDLLHRVSNLMRPFGDRARIIQSTSVVAAQYLKALRFDFVFIDAEHTQRAVLEDMRAWWPLVRDGGWLCGHDYGNAAESPHVAGVAIGVDEFAKSVGARVETDADYTWWLRKIAS